MKMHKLGYFENPASSSLWNIKMIQSWVRRQFVFFTTCNMCRYGALYLKLTSFLCSELPLHSISLLRCCGKAGRCFETRAKHVQLSGLNSQGQWVTRHAQVYPWKFATSLMKQMYKHFALVAIKMHLHTQPALKPMDM